MSRRKKKKLRNKFTDALGEEISSRKALDLEERKKNTPKVDLTKKVKPKPKTKKPAPAIAEYKVEEVETVEVEVDAEFEERVLAEADNDFHEEKPKRPKRKLTSEGRAAPQRPTFRTKTMQEKISDERLEENQNSDADLRRKLTRAETAGAVLAAVMLIYSLATYDKPLFFMAMAVLSHTLRPLIGGLFGKHNRSVQNALHGFSIALFFGALFFLFF